MEKNKILMIAIIALLVILLGAIVFLGITLGNAIGKGDEKKEDKVAVVEPVRVPQDQVETIPLSKPISTNLKTGPDGSKEHIVSVSIAIGVINTDKKLSPVMIGMMKSKESVIRDIVNANIRAKTYEELKRLDGFDILREEILTRLREEFDTTLIYQVYLADMYLE